MPLIRPNVPPSCFRRPWNTVSTNRKKALKSSTSTAGRSRTSRRTSAESTRGGGVKAAAGIVKRSWASANTCTATVDRLAPVDAVQRSATSFWTTRESLRGRGVVKELANQGAGEVVGDVARDDLIPCREGRTDVEPQDVGPHDLHVLEPFQRFAQRRDQPAVQLHRDHAACPARERHGQGSDAGADLEDLGLRREAGLLRNGVAQHRIGEEVLPDGMLEPDA